jgi:hypothetical protein
MSTEQILPKTVGELTDDLSVAEVNLGKVLVLIHQVLPRLGDGEFAADVQAAFRKASTCLERARHAHEEDLARRNLAVGDMPRSSVESETLAIIAAAIATVLDRPYKLVRVQPATVSVPHLNVWALEGRTQIFQSHKVR